MQAARGKAIREAIWFSGRVKTLALAFCCVLAAILLSGEPRTARAQFGIPNIVFGGGNIYVGHGGYRRGYSRRGYSRRSYARRGYSSRRYVRGNRGGSSASVSSSGMSKVTGSSGRVKSSTTD
jgi:hypothetical protein